MFTISYFNGSVSQQLGLGNLPFKEIIMTLVFDLCCAWFSGFHMCPSGFSQYSLGIHTGYLVENVLYSNACVEICKLIIFS